ncbi:MAG: hypothetical protein ACRDHU_06255 [Actinomycetota bacterium]
MNLFRAALIVVAATAITVAAMLAVRRRAPEGSYFADGDRASGVFGMLATGFALLLGFVVFLAFTRYDDARAGAQAEALTVVELFQAAQLFPEEARGTLSGELVCYGRSIVAQEWPTMESGEDLTSINPWILALFESLQTVEPVSNSEQSAFDEWLGLREALDEARRDRLHSAEGIVPPPIWLVLFFSAGILLVFMLFFADSGERAIVQGFLMGAVTAVVVATLLTLSVLNQPYSRDFGGIRPIAMQRTLATLENAREALDLTDPIPCDAEGQPA